MSRVGLKKRLTNLLPYVALTAVALVFLAPLVWTILTSLKSQLDALAIPPVWKFAPIWRNYLDAWQSRDFAMSFFNTTYVALFSIGISLLLGIPAGYALARFRLSGNNTVEVGLLVVRMLPEMLFIIPMYALYRKFGLYDTPLGLVLAFQIFNLPYTIWLLRQFISEVPLEIEEAARIDGCSTNQILWRVILPLIAPGVVATAILAFIVVWTNLLIPLALTYTDSPLIATTIANFRGYGGFNWPVMAAGSVIAIIPQFIFFLFAQKYIIRGLTLGAVKE
ncbi:MAG: carbohydrate ABC transporter permease [Bacillota bacterium]|nr:carbohydrate ABC transporter permease [Bacillota bacterium]